MYLGKLNEEFVTVEEFLSGKFRKHVNNTGDVQAYKDEVTLKAEAFVHYSYVKSHS